MRGIPQRPSAGLRNFAQATQYCLMLRRSLSCTTLLALLLLAGCGRLSSPERDFAEAYQAAHNSGYVEQVLALYYLEGVPDADRFLLMQAIQQDMRSPIASMRFEPCTPDDAYTYEFEDQTWGPNLPPEARFVVVFDNAQHLHASFLVGKVNDQFHFICAAPVNNTTNEAPKKSL